MFLDELQGLKDQLTARFEDLPELPHLFDPRPYQEQAWNAIQEVKRSVLIWHRRAGKDKLCWNYMIYRAAHRIGVYYYIFPTYSQGKKAIWEGRDKQGVAFLDHIPASLITLKNNSELKIILKNGSLIRIVGSDNIDALMGTPPNGVVFSEFSLQNPRAWDYIRPILVENEGWAIFNGTPRGKNHFYDLYLGALDNPKWYVSLLSAADTKALSEEDLATEKAEMSLDLYEQEYNCSFTRGQEGSFYGKALAEVERDGRITSVPYDTYAKVDTFWDLGVGDSTSIIFAQRIAGKEIHIIDHYESHGEGLDHYAKVLSEKNYNYGNHFAPHDIRVRELASGARTRLEIARDLGINFLIVPNMSVYEGIELTRSIMSKVWFDEKKCKYLVKCLLNYVKRYNEQYNVYSDQPLHTWASHCFVGETEVLTPCGRCRIMDLPLTGEIYTSCGIQKYRNPRITKKNAQLVEVSFVDNTKVKCTPDHLFLTEHGWRSAKSLLPDTKIQSYWMNSHNTSMAEFTEKRPNVSISDLDRKCWLDAFGLRHLEKFLNHIIFIIKIEIDGIIRSITLNVSRILNILALCTRKEKYLLNAEMQLDHGILQNKVWNGIEEMLFNQNPGLNGREKKGNVYGVKNISMLSSEKMGREIKNSVALIANLPIVGKVEKIEEMRDVWCLTVPETGNFCLSNGCIVANCADAFRMLGITYSQREDGHKSLYEIEQEEKKYRRYV